MTLDRSLLSEKFKKYREQFQISISELSEATGIDIKSLSAYEKEEKVPSGDDILILADFYKCDYKFFISNEKLASFEQTETLFRRHGSDFSKEDRWAIQEFLFLAECETYLLHALHKDQKQPFVFSKTSHNHKNNGIEAAKELRLHLNYKSNAVPMNIYEDFRDIGIHTFRRKLNNSDISGLYIKHPIAGKCILINYTEDIYRQRFSAAHEAAHAILNDDEDGVIVSFKGMGKDYREVGANYFASRYLMPIEFLKKIPDARLWNQKKALLWASDLKVSTEALSYALKNAGLIDSKMANSIKAVKVKRGFKVDPELPDSLSPKSLIRKKYLMARGLSGFYVNLCFESYRKNIISAARIAEMLLVEQCELYEIADLYKEVF